MLNLTNLKLPTYQSFRARRGTGTNAAGRLASSEFAGKSTRDLRIDFFRGLALIFIFIDHVPGNSLSHLTLRALGLSDAAEVFVLLAGYAAFLAYAGPLERDGIAAGAKRIFSRITDLYVAHLLLVAICVAFLALVARYFENPLYFEHVNLTPFNFDPLGAIWRFLVLQYQLGYLNILPLYIVLLAWFPALWAMLRRSVWLGLGFSVAVWAVAGAFRLNLPSWPEVYGWYFNPFAWQLLFAIGAVAAIHTRRGAALPRHPALIAASITLVTIGFVVAAPWINLPFVDLPRLVAYDALGYISKTYLSLWRLAHVLAVAYLVALLVPASAGWLTSRPGRWIVDCGKNSLDIFCLGTLLSFVGFVVMLEAGREWPFQVLVNAGGIASMLLTAAWLAKRKARRTLPQKALLVATMSDGGKSSTASSP